MVLTNMCYQVQSNGSLSKFSGVGGHKYPKSETVYAPTRVVSKSSN